MINIFILPSYSDIHKGETFLDIHKGETFLK